MEVKKDKKNDLEKFQNLVKTVENCEIHSTKCETHDTKWTKYFTWGCMVVFASFMCNVIVDGIIFSFGVVLLEIAETFNETRGKTAWVGSLQTGCYLSIGMLVTLIKLFSIYTISFKQYQIDDSAILLIRSDCVHLNQ